MFRKLSCFAAGLLLYSTAFALPSALTPDLTTGTGGNYILNGYDISKLGAVYFTPPLFTTDLGSNLSEAIAAIGPSSMVICYNDANLAAVDTVCSTLSLNGKTTLAPFKPMEGPLPYGSDPGILYNPQLKTFIRSEVNFNAINGYTTAVIISTSPDGLTWTPNQIISQTNDGQPGQTMFHDHPILTQSPNSIVVNWNGFPDPDANPGYPFLQWTTDGQNWSAPFRVLNDSVEDAFYDPAEKIALINVIGVGLGPFNAAGEWALVPNSIQSNLGTQFITLAACQSNGNCLDNIREFPTYLFGNNDQYFDWAPPSLRLQSQPGVAANENGTNIIIYWMEFHSGVTPRQSARIMTVVSQDQGYTWTPPQPIDDPNTNGRGDQFLPHLEFTPTGVIACFYQQPVPEVYANITDRCYYSQNGLAWTYKTQSNPWNPVDMIHGFPGDYQGIALAYPSVYTSFGFLGNVDKGNGVLLSQGQIEVDKWGCCAINPHSGGGWLLLLPAIFLFRRKLLLPTLALILFVSAAKADSLIGDCNNDGHVTINELIIIVDIDLGNASMADCEALQCTSNIDQPSIVCTIQAVANALYK